MTTPRGPRRAFWLPATRARIDRALDDEFRFHIEERVEQFMAEGMTRRQAEREVEGRFGDFEAHRTLTRQIDEDTVHQRRRRDRIRDVLRELRLAWRSLWRAPGFSFIALFMLTLGIGATTAIYAVLDAVVLRPLPYRHSGQLVSVMHPATVPGSGERKWGVSSGGYFQISTNNHSFSSVGMYMNDGFAVTNGGEAEMTQVAVVTASMFPVLEARPMAGRLLTQADDQPGAPMVVVLSNEFFQRRFGGDLSMIGRNLETSSGPFQIVGIVEPGLMLPMPGPFGSAANLAGFGVDVWMPLQANPNGPFYNSHPYVGVGRLKPGVTVDDAQRDVGAIFARFTETLPNAYSPRFLKEYNFRVEVSALQNTVLGPTVARTLWMLFGAVSLVLFIAAANVSNLFMVRMDARRREGAIRAALGADRAQMATHYLAETLLLCLSAAVAGVFLAAVGLRALLAIAPTDIPRLAHVALSWRSAVVALVIAAALGVVLGVMPLLRRGIDLGTLRDGGRGLSASPRQRAIRGGLVIGQVALALMLLAAAGLMFRSFDRLRHVQPGFDATNVIVFDISLPYTEFKTREAAIVFHRELQRRLLETPGVVGVGSIVAIPLEGFGTGCTVVFRENRPYPPGEQTPCVSTPTTVPGFFDALRIPVRGRVPTWSDVDSRSQAVVVTNALAARLWPGDNAIGKGIASNGPDSKVWYRVVGVSENLKAEALDQPATEAVFYAATALRAGDQSGDLRNVSYVIRTNGVDPFSIVPTARQMLAAMNPRVPFMNARTMNEVLRRSMARMSFIMLLLGVSAAAALALSAAGIYGVISCVVAQRRSEIGIRMALGASINDVVRLVMTQSVRLAVTGIAIGLVGTFALTRVLQAVLFEVSPTDPLVLTTVVVVLMAIVSIASFVPARRAARIDPAETMRAV